MYPAVCALFLAGFFYKRANARGSLIAILVTPTWALLFSAAESARFVPAIPFLNRAMIDFLLALAIIWAFRTRGDAIPANATIDRSFSPEIAAQMRTIPWYASFRFWAALLVLMVIALYVRFF
jgi:hypothetical protein